MDKQKILNLLGLAMRAGKLVTGEELTVKDIQANKTKFLFIAADTGINTKKKMIDKSAYYTILYNDSFNQDELSLAIGRIRKVIGVNDQGFANKFKELTKS